jgi:hypothetical protein
MSNTITGKLKVKFDTQTFDSGFQKREFVVTTAEQYPQDIKLELLKDKCSVLDSFQVGQELTVDFNLRGNEYNGKYYVSLQAWRVLPSALPKVQSAPPKNEDELTF